MRFLVANYHYIHEKDKYPYSGIYPVSPEKFEEQIQKLSKTYKFVSQQDVLEKNLPEKSCLITFDDGLKSQYENALPILDKYKIPAIFFVNGLPYAENKACLIHKIHYCRANIKNLARKINIKVNYPDIKELKIQSPFSSEEEMRLKYLLQQTPPEIIDRIFREIIKDEKTWCEENYINKTELKDLAKRNYLGIHGYSHNSLVNAKFKDLKADFKKNIEIIKNITGYTPQAISYPYGYGEILKAAKAAKSVGLKLGFTVEKTINQTLKNPLLLARVDTNYLSEII